MSDAKEKFWIDEPCSLFKSANVFPSNGLTKDQKLNALTRLALGIAIILYFLEYEYWLIFLILALLIIVLFHFINVQIEGFSVTPTYNSTDFQQTIVSPVFAEEWQIPPPAYDIYSATAPPGISAAKGALGLDLQPQSYPYGQYLTKTNLLPSDEYMTHVSCGGTRQAREFVNSAFLRHDLSQRESLTRLYKLRLNRRFRNQCQDSYSPYSSY
jgi:uncharacterized protein DUF5762